MKQRVSIKKPLTQKLKGFFSGIRKPLLALFFLFTFSSLFLTSQVFASQSFLSQTGLVNSNNTILEIILSVVLVLSLGLSLAWILIYLKHRHREHEYTGAAGSHKAHDNFSDIKYHLWLLKHLPFKLQPTKVKNHAHQPYTLKDNFLFLLFHPYFGALRKAIAFWLIISISFSSSGIYFLANASPTQAAGDFSIKTGYFLGSGVTRSITGLGFQPELVIIKSDTAAGQLVWKSSAMPANVSTYLGVATADNTETEITLDADGFTVSAALEVNTANVNYTYVALAGSDCTSAGVFCVGSYTGDGASTKSITTGFQPDLVWAKRTTALAGVFRTSSMSTNHAGYFSATANNTTGTFFTTLDGTGFTAGLTNNTNGGKYYYVAFKNIAGKTTVGQFTGNGVDNRDISGVGFEPDFVFVKQDSAVTPVFNTTDMYGDYSAFTTAAANAVNNIQSLDSDGFQVGNSTSVNAAGIVSHYFAIGGSPDPSPAGSFLMERGNYTGTGVSHVISTSFVPNLVIVKGDTIQYAVWSTSLEGDATEYFAAAGAAFTSGINIITDTSGFTVGTNATVNSNGITYEYIAFGNATSPRLGNGAADFYIGSYTGNGLDGRKIDHLGIGADMVVIKRTNGTANQSFWKTTSPVMTDNTTAYFSATTDDTTGVLVKTLDSGGFTLGSNAGTNAAGATYNWFAFKEGANFDIGSYAGDGVADKEITGVGFQPDFVWTKRNSAIAAVHKSSDSGIASNYSQHFMNLANDTNDIKTFTSDGFTLGNSAEVNTSGGTYRYAAWDSSTSSNPPSTPTNSSPAGGATAQNLNATLTGSAYSDPDSNAQTDSQWQVDDDSDFATPVWTRTAGASGVTTSVTSANGTFANELSGKTELDHATTYYWRVRYSDGTYSSWSTGTSFTTNTISTPTHSSPADQATVTTLTPTLTTSAFSDTQSGHTSANAQWQISASSSFSSPIYDSGTVSYGASLVVPSATLSNGNVYYWRVRYQDSTSQWSSYSTATRFLVQQSTSSSIAKLTPLFGSTVVDQGDAVKIDAQFLSSAGAPINDATATINIYNPSGTLVVTAQTMSYIASSNGIYRYSYTIPSTSGSYLYDVTATSGSTTGYGAENFEVRTIVSDISSAKSAAESAQSAAVSNQSTLSTINTNLNTANTNINTINTNVSAIKNATVSVTGVISDSSPSDSSFKTNLTAGKDDFYKNMVITFTSGDNSGQSRRISSYSQSDKKISVDPSFSYTPADGDTFVINVGSVRAEELSGSAKSTIESVQTKLNSLSGTLPSNFSGVYDQLVTITNQLSSLGAIKGNGAEALYDLSPANKDDIKYLKNKILDLQAAMEITKAMLSGDQNSVFSTWYTFNSVVLNMLIANPTDRDATIPFKAYLPKEAKPEHIISSGGMKVEYDEGANAYYVSGEFDLDAGDSITKQVEIKDIWLIDESELNGYKTQANDLYNEAKSTAYSAQALVLKNDTNNRIDKILRSQKENNADPTEHIQTFRNNQDDLISIKDNLKKMTDLVTSAGAGRGMLASVGGIQTVASWGIIVMLIAGFVILGVFSYTMWKHQMMVTALASGKLQDGKRRLSPELVGSNVLDEIKKPMVALSIPRLNLHFLTAIYKLKWLALLGLVIIIIFAFYKGFVSNPWQALITNPTSIPTVSPTSIPSPIPSPTPVEKKVTVLETETGWLNVREEPTIKSEVLGKADVDKTYTELDREENDLQEEWIKIRLNNEIEGWVLGKYVEKASN